MESTEKRLGCYSLDPEDEAGWRAIAEMSQTANGCGQIAEGSMTRLTTSDEDGWRNIATAWEEPEHEDTAAKLASLRALVQDVLDHWHSDSWSLSPFAGVREWQRKALETLDPKARSNTPQLVASLPAGSGLSFAEVHDDAPVWL